MADIGGRIEPYNDMWLDCVTNNLIAMLVRENEAYTDITCYMDANYLKKVYDQRYSSDDVQGELLAEGLYIPKVEYSNELLEALIEIKTLELDSQDDDVHECIRTALGEGCFVFVTVDRYFYPSGVNANKTHLTHPTFIYGYDDEFRCYKALEDCMRTGWMDHYRIPDHSIDASCELLLNAGKKIKLGICKVRDAAKQFDQKLQLRKLAASLERSLAGGQIYNEDYDLYYLIGMDALQVYNKEFNHLFSNLKNHHFFRVRSLSYSQYHTRNKKIAQFISDNYGLDMSQIDQCYSYLCDMWQRFKNKGNYILEKQKDAPDLKQTAYIELGSLLEAIIEKEREAAERLLSICGSAGE